MIGTKCYLIIISCDFSSVTLCSASGVGECVEDLRYKIIWLVTPVWRDTWVDRPVLPPTLTSSPNIQRYDIISHSQLNREQQPSLYGYKYTLGKTVPACLHSFFPVNRNAVIMKTQTWKSHCNIVTEYCPRPSGYAVISWFESNFLSNNPSHTLLPSA